MTLKEFSQIPIGEVKCEQAGKTCYPSMMATKMLLRGEDDIFLYCDQHAPSNSKERAQDIDSRYSGLQPENLSETVSELSGPGFAKLRSTLTTPFGIRLQSTGAAANLAQSHIIMQTLDASPYNPYEVTIDQHILEPFTGPGQFDLVERDSRRRVFDGASAGGTPILTSATMNWQSGDADKPIKVGRNPGRYFTILSRQSATQVTLNANITLPSTGLTLTMDGESEVTVATKSELTGGINAGSWSRLVKPITADKTYRVIFVPGTTGDGIYSINVRRLLS